MRKRSAVVALGSVSPPRSPKHARISEGVTSDRELLMFCGSHQIKELKLANLDHLAELFFLQNNGNLFEFVDWRAKPSQLLLTYWRANGLDFNEFAQSCQAANSAVLSPGLPSPKALPELTIPPLHEVKAPQLKFEPLTPKTRETTPKSDIVAEPTSSRAAEVSPILPVTSADGIAEKAKQHLRDMNHVVKEAWVLSRIAELRREGLWSGKRLPKCADPPRSKTHWDYLLEECQWMAVDFEQERRWKRAANRKVSQTVLKRFRDDHEKVAKQELERERELRKIANAVAREILNFWKNARKIVDYKSQCLHDEKRRKALDSRLDYMVGQSEKFSTWVQEGLLRSKSPSTVSKNYESDSAEDVSDDESTIDRDEQTVEPSDVKTEVNLLEKESQLPLDDVLAELPPEYVMFLLEKQPPLPESDDNQTLAMLQSENKEEREEGLENFAMAAEKYQPTGYTLETTKVVTKVPFLLKHTLREYQHVGLDWLVALHKKNLNGILADEMGLGKTIQTIALLAHLACEEGNWGPHLIVVPTSVMLNWEMECKKWCPAFKILTYYGSKGERLEKRRGWTKANTFHVCITSYKLVLQDHRAFRSKKWKYLILDEAQNIKNFKSQRWQLLLNFNSEHRLLLTGTPLQNNLLELWSLMHFLMPQIFASHRDFQDWFAKPLTGMIEGSQEFNDSIVKRLHKVLRPFLLRRIKSEVEKQLPRKYEHVIMCSLSKRQRFLYDDFMSRSTTKAELRSGNMMGVMNILMQLRKCCNHPNLFEPRGISLPLQMHPLVYRTTSCAFDVVEKPLEGLNWSIDGSSARVCALKDLLVTRNDICNVNNILKPFPRLPRVGNFKFATRKRPLIEVLPGKEKTPQKSVTGQLQFVIPTTVAQHISFDRPVLIQLQTSRGPQLVPLMISAPIFATTAEDGSVTAPPSNISTSSSLPILQIVPSSYPDRPPVVHLTGNLPLTALEHGILSPDSWSATAVPDTNKVASAPKGSIPARTVLMSTAAPKPSLSASSIGPDETKSENRDVTVTVVRQMSLSKRAEREFDVPEIKRRRTEFEMRTQESFLRKGVNNAVECNIFAEATTFPSCAFLDSPPHAIPSGLQASIQEHLDSTDTCARFAVYVAPARASQAELDLCHPEQSQRRCLFRDPLAMTSLFSDRLLSLHTVASRQTMSFPELRLIEYDCGKLQTLATLLSRLNDEGHRCLIFTQMSKMLDIFEVFLSYHGYKYLRLDGGTKIEDRQMMMEKFNVDARIFVFILSTRSGGIGVNLTGADTVIFYDSDWNPTMDAQAQDRCHRIGQTRDVHIYRLICERTVEENILKKAQQKQLLGTIAIEEGEFTTGFYKHDNLRDIFDVEVGVGDMDAAMQQQQGALSERAMHEAMARVEDESDALAAKQVEAEEKLEQAEFDECQPVASDENEVELKSKLERDMDGLLQQLSPVERYAVKFMECALEPQLEEELKQADDELEAQRRRWEEDRARWLEMEHEKELDGADESLALTYPKEDGLGQVSRRMLRGARGTPVAAAVASTSAAAEPGPSAYWKPDLVIRTRHAARAAAKVTPSLMPRRGRPPKKGNPVIDLSSGLEEEAPDDEMLNTGNVFEKFSAAFK